MYAKLYKNTQTEQVAETAQTMPIEDRESDMVMNNAGGYNFKVSELMQIRQYLISGVLGGTYYVSESDTFMKTMHFFQNIVNQDLVFDVLDLIESLNTQQGDKPVAVIRKRESLFFLAYIKSNTTAPDVLEKTYTVASRIIRTFSDIMEFFYNVRAINGKAKVSSGMKRVVLEFLNKNSNRNLVYQATKYRNRNGFSTRDVLRLTHPRPQTMARGVIYNWMVSHSADGYNSDNMVKIISELVADLESVISDDDKNALEYLIAFEKLKNSKSPDEISNLILEYGFTWEMIPNIYLRNEQVVMALLGMDANGNVVSEFSMPMTALIRNVSRFASNGMFNNQKFLSRFEDILTGEGSQEAMLKAKLHPVRIAMAMKEYQNRSESVGYDSRVAWILQQAFLNSFGTIEPSRKRVLHALDVSYSMNAPVQGASMFSCSSASALMLTVAIKTEKMSNVITMGFSHEFVKLDINRNDSWENIEYIMRKVPMGGTDCSLPMLYALENDIDVDAFFIYTDNETYWGHIHPVQALEKYRNSKPERKNAKLVVWAMTSSDNSIIDPLDNGQLLVNGFDATAVEVVNHFLRD